MEYLILVLVLLVASIVSTVIGIIWHSPMLFGKIWQRAIGLSTEPKKRKQMIKTILTGFVGDFITALIFLLILISFGNVNSFVLAVILWVGFIAPNIAYSSIHENRPWKVFWITSVYKLFISWN